MHLSESHHYQCVCNADIKLGDSMWQGGHHHTKIQRSVLISLREKPEVKVFAAVGYTHAGNMLAFSKNIHQTCEKHFKHDLVHAYKA